MDNTSVNHIFWLSISQSNYYEDNNYQMENKIKRNLNKIKQIINNFVVDIRKCLTKHSTENPHSRSILSNMIFAKVLFWYYLFVSQFNTHLINFCQKRHENFPWKIVQWFENLFWRVWVAYFCIDIFQGIKKLS